VAIQGPNPWGDVANKQFNGGAKGTGASTAPDDDAEAFSQAADYIHSAGGGFVFYGPFNFRLNSAPRKYSDVGYLTFGGTLSGVGAASVGPITNIAPGGTIVPGFVGQPWFDPTAAKYGCVGDSVTDDFITATGTGLQGWMADILAATGVGFLPSNKIFRTSKPIQVWQATGVGAIWIMGTGMTSCGFTVLATDYGNFVSDFVFTGPGPSWIVTDVKFTDFKIDGQARNGAAPAGRCGGISFGARTVCERVWLDDINWLAWSMRNSTTPDSTRMVDCRSSRGNASGSDNISGGFNLSDIQIIRHRWDGNLACLSVFDFVPATNVKLIDCTNFSTLAIAFEAMTNSLIIGLISTGGGGIFLQSDAGYGFAAGTSNCLKITVTDCLLVGANAIYQAADFHASIAINFGKGGAATVLGYGIKVDHNTIIGATLDGIAWLNNDTTYSSGGNSCDTNTVIDCNASNTQVGVNILGTSTTDGGVGIFWAHGGSPGDTCRGNTCLDQRTVKQMRHGYQFGQSNGGAASQVGAGLYLGLDNRTSGLVAAGSNFYVPGTLINAPQVRGWLSSTGVAGAQVLDPSTQEDYYWTLVGDVTLSAIANRLPGQRVRVWFQQDGAGGRRIAGYDASFDFNWQPTPVANSRSMFEAEVGTDNSLHLVSSAAYDQAGNMYVVGNIWVGSAVPVASALNAQITSVTPAGNSTIFELVIVVAAGGLAANTKICTITYGVTFGVSGVSATLPLVVNQSGVAGLANVNFYTSGETAALFDLYCDQAMVPGTYRARCLAIGRK
jgi:hypothetical protein